MPHPDFDLVIFDCDGVLIDSEPIVCRIEAELLSALGYPITPEEVNHRFVGLSAASVRALVERDLGRPLPEDYALRKRPRIEAAFRADLRAIAGIEALLDALPIPACVASSTIPDRLRFALELVGLHHRFAPHVFSATMVARGKPAPDLFLHAASAMGALPARCLVVEDSIHGIEAAVAAGMTPWGFCGGGHCAAGHAARLEAAGAARIFSDMKTLAAVLLPPPVRALRRAQGGGEAGASD